MFIEYPHKFNKARSKVQSNSQRIGANGQMPEGKTATLLLFKLSSKWGKITNKMSMITSTKASVYNSNFRKMGITILK